MSRGILPCQPGQDDSSRATTAVKLHRADIALRLLEFMVEAIGLILDQHTRSAQVSVGNVVQCEMGRGELRDRGRARTMPAKRDHRVESKTDNVLNVLELVTMAL